MGHLNDDLLCLERLETCQTLPSLPARNPLMQIYTLLSHEDPYQCFFTETSVITRTKHEMVTQWMCQVSVLREQDVFPTAVNIYTRFMRAYASRITSDDQLQLTAACALHLASKLLECTPMLAEDLAYFTDDAYSPEDIRLMDIVLLSTLSFDLLCVPPGHFVEAYLSLMGLEGEKRRILKNDTLRRINLALIDVDILCCKPSLVAAACLLASMYIHKVSVDNGVECLAEAIGAQTDDILRLCQLSMIVVDKHRPEVYDAVTAYQCGVQRQDSGVSSMEDTSEQLLDRSDSDMDSEDEDFVDMLADESLDEESEEDTAMYPDYLIDSDSGIQDDIHIVPAPFAAVDCFADDDD